MKTKLLIFILIIILVAGGVKAEGLTLLGQWTFDMLTLENEHLNNISYKNLSAGQTLDTGAYKQGNSSLNFVSGRNTLSGNDIIPVDPMNNNKTISFWFRTNTSNSLADSIYLFSTNNNAQTYSLHIRLVDGNIVLSYGGLGASYTMTGLTAYNFSDDAWHFLTYTINGSTTAAEINVFVDNYQVIYNNTVTIMMTQDFSDGSFGSLFGLSREGTPNLYPFYMDDLRVYNGSSNFSQHISDMLGYIFEIQTTNLYADPIIESTMAFYNLNVSPPILMTNVTAVFNFNGTNYPTDTDSSIIYNVSNVFVFETNITVPLQLDYSSPYTVASFWNVTYEYADDAANISVIYPLSQTVNLATGRFAVCNDTFYEDALNFTVYDEYNSSLLIADWTSLFSYNLHDRFSAVGSASNTTVGQIKQDWCIEPSDNSAIFDISGYVQYNSVDYPGRRYYISNGTYSNITTSIPLYLLGVDRGIYIRYRTVTSTGSALAGVSVTAQKLIGGSYVTIEQETSDTAGLVTFWLGFDYDYQLTFSKVGYITSTISVSKPSSGDIQNYIMLAEGESVNTNSSGFSSQLTYTFYPLEGDLINDTTYYFAAIANSTSSSWIITDCNYTLKLTNNTVLLQAAATYTTTWCYSNQSYNIVDYTNVVSVLTLEQLQGTIENVQDLSKTYSVIYFYQGKYSLMTLVDDVNSFSKGGFNNFTRILIAVFIICTATFYANSRITFPNPDALIMFVLGLVLLFSWMGWFTVTGLSDPFVDKYAIFTTLLCFGVGFMLWRNQ